MKKKGKPFWDYVDKNGPIPQYAPHLGPCWIWNGPLTHKNYGEFRAFGVRIRAHRFAYELLVGPIPSGLEIGAEPAREHIWKTACENCGIKTTIWFVPPADRRERQPDKETGK